MIAFTLIINEIKNGDATFEIMVSQSPHTQLESKAADVVAVALKEIIQGFNGMKVSNEAAN